MNLLVTKVLDRFFKHCENVLDGTKSILVACSGGPDSVALVYGLKNLVSSRPYRFVIGHVNHHLRGKESDLDQVFVEKLGQAIGWEVLVQLRPMSVRDSGNLEEKTRVTRYKALNEMAEKAHCQLILTGHTLDDQVETILMNLSRGAGPDGLTGMLELRSLSSSMLLGRPLLSLEKKRLWEMLKENKISFRTDRSNKRKTFLRNWLRHELIPRWEKRCPQFKNHIANLGQILKGEKKEWDRRTSEVLQAVSRPYQGKVVIDLETLLQYSPAVQRRVLRQIWGSDLVTFGSLERLRRWMTGPLTGGRHFQLKGGWIAERLSRSKGSPSARLFWFYNSRKEKIKNLVLV